MAEKGAVDRGHNLNIPPTTVPPIQPAGNERQADLNVPVVAIPTIQPVENVPESDFTVPLVELKESPLAEDERDTAVSVPVVLIGQASPANNEPLEKYIIPLDGKWIPSADASQIGKNFTTLTNMRYADGHPESILGMTKINSTALTTYLKARTAFHFRKSQPAESHVLVQAHNTGLTASRIIQSITAIPSAGDFVGGAAATTLFDETGDVGIGQFSDAPNGQVVYCNKVDSLIWGGDEMRVGALIASSAALSAAADTATNPKNYTEVINNTKTDSANSAILGGGIDSFTKAIWHFDEAQGAVSFADSSGNAHTLTAAGTAITQEGWGKFGPSGLSTPASGDYASAADSADWAMGTGVFTIDFWLRIVAPATAGLWQQYVDGNNKVIFKVDVASGPTWKLYFAIVTAASQTVLIETSTETVNLGFHHVALIRGWGGSANAWAITIDGTAYGTTTDVDTWPDIAAGFDVGRSASQTVGETTMSSLVGGYIDEFRVSKGIARWTANFSPPAAPSAAAYYTFLIGSTRPAQGAKFYIPVPNGTADTLTVKEFNGNTWVTLTHTDNTDSGGASFALTGTSVTWPSTLTTSKPKYLEGYYLYWYQFTVTAGSAEISHMTLDCPFQPIIDLWDGVFRQIVSFYVTKTAPLDNSINVRDDVYASDDPATYADVSSLTALTQYLELGFTEKTTGVMLNIPSEFAQVAATVMTVDYWNGTEYVTVGAISDGTSAAGVSFARSGVVTWSNNSINAETKKIVAGGHRQVYTPSGNIDVYATIESPSLYFYRIKFSVALDLTTRLYYVGGIPVKKEIAGYSFGIHAADRLLLGCDNYEKKNEFLISAQNRPDVFNGLDTDRIEIGTESPLTCAASLSAQYASNIYNLILVFKPEETWVMKWEQTDNGTVWERYRISANIGCPAPQTLKTVSASFGDDLSQSKLIAIWRGNDGIYVSNGQAPQLASKDILNVFDQYKTPHVNLAMVPYESAGIVQYNGILEYHWCWATDLYQISFTAGDNEPAVGSTITGNTSAATGVIDHIGTITGSWAGNDAAGIFYVRPITGTWQAETIKQGATTIAICSGAAALTTDLSHITLDKEFVLDLHRFKWYEVDRSSGKYLQCIVSVGDTSGNPYPFGFIDTGYMERLEYGASFDGGTITATMQVGDQILSANDPLTETEVIMANLISIPHTTTTTATLTNYIDGATSGSANSMSLANSTHRTANTITTIASVPGVLHGFKLVWASSTDAVKFIPMILAVFYRKTRDHLRGVS